jgi:hypothetical protein
MTEQPRGGLFPANALDFAILLRRPPSPPRIPTREEIRADPYLRTIAERQKQLDFELLRVHLAQSITRVLYDDMVAVANEQFGTKSSQKTYTTCFNQFARWAEAEGYPSLPSCPEVVATFLLVNAKGMNARCHPWGWRARRRTTGGGKPHCANRIHASH